MAHLAAIENQVERFAPGFRDTILARQTMGTQELQRYNANYIGGDINGGVHGICGYHVAQTVLKRLF